MDGMNIYYNYTVEVNNTEHMATLKEGDIHLYIGDKNIDYYFKVEKAQFTFRGTSETESLIESTMPSKAAVSVLKPNGDIVIGSEAEVVGSRIKWTVTPDLIDEDVEVGDFTLAISLIESSTDSMATLPPITNQVHIHERVTPTPGSSLNAVVNEAVVGLAQVQSDDTALDVFDSEGNYIKTVWKSGDKITQTKLNKIEDGLSGLSTQFKDIANKIDSGNLGNNVEPALMDMPRIYFSEGTLPTTKTATMMRFDYYSKTAEYHGWAEIKCQGNSSMQYNKKNFTIKLYKDREKTQKLKIDFKGWGKQSKFVLKANWIDLTHARNVVSARIWGDIVKSRSGYANLPELLRTSPNQGAVDGFPVTVYGNGYYQGRYTLNIPKDKWMSNMDDSLDTHCILCGENYASGCFRATANINGNDWTDELHDTVPASIKTRWNECISFVMNSTDEEFKANLHNYFDVDSLIDYLLYGIESCGFDAFGKNQIYFTYDGQKWIASMYDMDSTWGLWWNGSQFVATDYPRESFEDFNGSGREGNLLYIRLQKLFVNEIKARYAELKQTIFTYPYLVNKFEEFAQICPLDIVKEDYASTTANGAYTGIPSRTTNNIQQIRSYINARLTYVDGYINSLTPPVPSVPCTGITLNTNNLVFEHSTTAQTLTATLTPTNTTDSVLWSVSPTGICTVNKGVVTPVTNGSCVITATCGTQSVSCSVTVNLPNVAVTALNLDKDNITLGDTIDTSFEDTLTATLTPSNATNKSVTWTVDNENVELVADGLNCTVKAKAIGNSVVTCTSQDTTNGTISDTCNVTVSSTSTDIGQNNHKVFNIDSTCMNTTDNKLVDKVNNIEATLTGTPTVNNNQIVFTANDKFSFDIGSLNLSNKDRTFRIKFTPTVLDTNTKNICLVGQELLWTKSTTVYVTDSTLIMQHNNTPVINDVKVGFTSPHTKNNRLPNGEVPSINTEYEIVVSEEVGTNKVRWFVNGTLVQDGATELFNPLYLGNTEGSYRFEGSYSLIEIYDEFCNTYDDFTNLME